MCRDTRVIALCDEYCGYNSSSDFSRFADGKVSPHLVTDPRRAWPWGNTEISGTLSVRPDAMEARLPQT
jgi:hypothetical protein